MPIFILSSVHGHLGCFLVLAIVDSAVMNIGVQYPFRPCFSPHILYARVGLQGHMIAA